MKINYNSKQMSRLSSASLDMTMLREGRNGVQVLAALPPKPALLLLCKNAVIPSVAYAVCEVEESPC